MTSAPTPEELAAILAALATRRPATQDDVSPYERWRRQRIKALHRRA